MKKMSILEVIFRKAGRRKKLEVLSMTHGEAALQVALLCGVFLENCRCSASGRGARPTTPQRLRRNIRTSEQQRHGIWSHI